MLLRFTSPDMLNTSLVDVATGDRAYEITTEVTVLPEPSSSSSSSSVSFSATASVLLSPSEDLASSSSIPWRHPEPKLTESSEGGELRRTQIWGASGKVLVDVTWKGRHPDITICDERIGGLTDLFGSSTVRFMPKVLAIPTRFDTEFVWLATAESLSLFDYDSDSVQGTFHQNCIRIPAPLKSSKSKQSHQSPQSLKRKPSKLLFSSLKHDSSIEPSSPTEEGYNVPPSPTSSTPKSTFIPTHLPGVGSNYLEFESHPLALDVEIILSFLMMEILRRGRFSLTPYTFERPTGMWQFKTKDLFKRRRRNTV